MKETNTQWETAREVVTEYKKIYKAKKEKNYNNKSSKFRKEPPLCLFPKCRNEGIKHFIKLFHDATHEEKIKMRKQLVADKYKDGPSRSARAQVAQRDKTINTKSDHKSIVRRI